MYNRRIAQYYVEFNPETGTYCIFDDKFKDKYIYCSFAQEEDAITYLNKYYYHLEQIKFYDSLKDRKG